MWLEQALRRVSVGKRVAIAGMVLVLPMTFLILFSISVLKQQEADVHRSIDEAVHVLLPLATLEYDLQRALTDDVAAESGESVPDYSGLTSSIDRTIAQLDNESGNADVPVTAVRSAEIAWQSARPVIRQLIEHVAPVKVDGGAAALKIAKQDLVKALGDIEAARHHLSRVVRDRSAHSVTVQQRQLRMLVWTWTGTLLAALLLVAALVYSIVKPARELGQAVRRLTAGDLSVRVNTGSRDELGVVATYLNAMAARFNLRRNALEDEARRDTLTGLPNRRALETTLEDLLSGSSSQDSPVTVLMIDVDHFKQINDRLGHPVGDQALVWLAGIMRDCFRENDLLGRYAGDEFMALLPDTSPEKALAVAERLCDLVRAEADPARGRPTVTVGVATADASRRTAEALLQAADEALYQAKERGRALVAQA